MFPKSILVRNYEEIFIILCGLWKIMTMKQTSSHPISETSGQVQSALWSYSVFPVLDYDLKGEFLMFLYRTIGKKYTTEILLYELRVPIGL